MKVGITALVAPRELSFEETLRKIKGWGYDAFEPVIVDDGETGLNASTAQLAGLAAKAKALGVELVSTCPGLSNVKVNLLTDDEAARAEGVEATRKMLRVTRDLGIGAMLHTLGWPGETPYYDVMYAQGLKSLKELVPTCEEYGVKIAVEYVWNRFLSSPLEMNRFLDEVGSPMVGFYFDPGNMSFVSYAHQWARICGRHILRVHMKDFKCEFRPPGFTAVLTFPKLLAGDVNFPLVMKELRAIGFDGALVSEIDPGEGGYEETAATIREIMAM